jgi:hydrogenase expression/formation protein HypD
MKYVDEFRNPVLAQDLSMTIHQIVNEIEFAKERPIQLMEFCGGHTHTIFRYGIEQLLPKCIELVHGPGCPVCVLPRGRVDDCLALASRKEVIFATFGDAMRVPGSRKSLLQARADGADIRMVYSPLDALQLAKNNPEREVIFFALGFETTMPSTALTVLQAEADGVYNFSVFCNHITTIPTIKALLDSPDMQLDGFIAPGHVSMVIGERPFDLISKVYRKPIVITGFEPLDILQSIWLLLKQIAEKRSQTENQYARVVAQDGNNMAQDAVQRVYELRDFFELRGLGSIDNSGVRIREEYARFDAERKFAVANMTIADPSVCQCGEVLKGLIKPWRCKVFGTQCTPENPLGALMVSSEGACAAYYNFGNLPELLRLKQESVESGDESSKNEECVR